MRRCAGGRPQLLSQQLLGDGLTLLAAGCSSGYLVDNAPTAWQHAERGHAASLLSNLRCCARCDIYLRHFHDYQQYVGALGQDFFYLTYVLWFLQ